jgi:pSer/pThr/pTyr-binding forkhead associated (FHA) protein
VNPRLFAVAGPLAGGAFPLGPAPLTLGRQDTCELRIRDRAVSRQHCAIALEGDRFVVRDLDSRHGTFVNGLPVRERALQPLSCSWTAPASPRRPLPATAGGGPNRSG